MFYLLMLIVSKLLRTLTKVFSDANLFSNLVTIDLLSELYLMVPLLLLVTNSNRDSFATGSPRPEPEPMVMGSLAALPLMSEHVISLRSARPLEPRHVSQRRSRSSEAVVNRISVSQLPSHTAHTYGPAQRQRAEITLYYWLRAISCY